jgi:hypothetical protein
MRGARLDKLDFTRASFQGAHLHETWLTGADLKGADFSRATLVGANLTEAFLGGANLVGADCRNAVLGHARLIGADLTCADLSGADLYLSTLVRSTVSDCVLRGARVYGMSTWDLKGEPKDQTGLIVNWSDQPPIEVDEIEVAQLVHLLIRHEKLRDVLNTIMKRGVLILGPFKHGGVERLHEIGSVLRSLRYRPIVFDFERPECRSLRETVKTLFGLSRFVIADLSGPSVPAELEATVSDFRVPVVPIMQKGKHPYGTFRDLLENDWVLGPIIEFGDTAELIGLLPSRVIEPAERRAKDRMKKLAELHDPVRV